MTTDLYQVLRKIPDVTEEEARQIATSVINLGNDYDDSNSDQFATMIDLCQVLRKIPDVTEEEAKQAAISAVDPDYHFYQDDDPDRAVTKSDISMLMNCYKLRMRIMERDLADRIMRWSSWWIVAILFGFILWLS